jgi:hypothetical protein
MKVYFITNFAVGVSTFSSIFSLQKRVHLKSCDYDFVAWVSQICSSVCAEVALQIGVVQLASMKARL